MADGQKLRSRFWQGHTMASNVTNSPGQDRPAAPHFHPAGTTTQPGGATFYQHSVRVLSNERPRSALKTWAAQAWDAVSEAFQSAFRSLQSRWATPMGLGNELNAALRVRQSDTPSRTAADPDARLRAILRQAWPVAQRLLVAPDSRELEDAGALLGRLASEGTDEPGWIALFVKSAIRACANIPGGSHGAAAQLFSQAFSGFQGQDAADQVAEAIAASDLASCAPEVARALLRSVLTSPGMAPCFAGTQIAAMLQPFSAPSAPGEGDFMQFDAKGRAAFLQPGIDALALTPVENAPHVTSALASLTRLFLGEEPIADEPGTDPDGLDIAFEQPDERLAFAPGVVQTFLELDFTTCSSETRQAILAGVTQGGKSVFTRRELARLQERLVPDTVK